MLERANSMTCGSRGAKSGGVRLRSRIIDEQARCEE